MPIEAILTALDGQADTEIERILAEAQAKVSEITEQAYRRKQAEIDRFVADKVAAKRFESERMINAAHTASRRAMADVRREVFEEVFAVASERLSGIRQEPIYPQVLKHLIEEAIAGDCEGCTIHVDPRDAEHVSQAYGSANIVADLETAGGAVVVSADGRVRRSNTIEDRLARIHDECVEAVSEVLYR